MRRSDDDRRWAKVRSLGQGFPKASRILKRPEFKQLGEVGKRLVGRHFIVVYRSSKHPQSRLGITVTKKVGNAVTRNRLKRVCREFFRTYQKQLAAAYDVHVIARNAAAGAAHKELVYNLEKLFSQIT
jgi:ribonuclease P protein component